MNAIPEAYKPQGLFPVSRSLTVRRLTDSPASGCVHARYFLTGKAAENLKAHPEVLLHNRLYDRNEERNLTYSLNGEDLLSIRMRSELRIGDSKKPFLENVFISSPEENPFNESYEKAEITPPYPSPLLPFDINSIRYVMESQIFAKGGHYTSADAPGALYLSSCPFATYQSLHHLVGLPGEISERIRDIRQAVEIGSGLGIISFVVSRFLARDARIRGLEIDSNLAGLANQAQGYLTDRFKHDLSGVTIQKRDALRSQDIISESQALFGWFPIGGVADEQVIEAFRALPKGALVFQLFAPTPLSAENAGTSGFRHLPELSHNGHSFHLFERV